MTSPVVALADYCRVPVFRTAVETHFTVRAQKPSTWNTHRRPGQVVHGLV